MVKASSIKLAACLACILCLSNIAAAAPIFESAAHPRRWQRPVRPQHGSWRTGGTDDDLPPNYLSVRTFGAKGDGVTDDSKAFQAALSLAAQDKGGIVVVPEGTFAIGAPLTIGDGVVLQGTYTTPPSHTVGQQTQDTPTTGTVLYATYGSGDEGGAPLVTLQHNAALQGMTIYYPGQNGTAEPVPFPWSIDMVGDNAAVQDVECLNCWNAIRAIGAGRHYIARIQGQPINTGLLVDKTFDIGRVEDVHWNPWFSPNPVFMRHQLMFGRAFVFGRSDWEYVLNTFAFGYAVGYHFIETPDGAMNGNLLGIGMDLAINASILVEASQPMGLLVTNAEFTAFVSPQWIDPKSADFNPTHVVVGPSNAGAVKFVNSAFWGPANQIALVEGTGTVGFVGCTFTEWDGKDVGRYAIQAFKGSSVQVNSCEFQKKAPQIHLEKGVKRATVIGNIIHGEEQFDYDRLNGKLKVDLNSSD